MVDPLELPLRLDLGAAPSLLTNLAARVSDEKVLIDASSVIHFGALCLQIVLSAARDIKANGGTLEIIGLSDRVTDQIAAMGMTPITLAEGGQ